MASFIEDDPFKDPSLAGTATPQPRSAAAGSETLAVGRRASLTLGTDSLVVLDEALLEPKGPNCCGISLAGSKPLLAACATSPADTV